MKHPCPQEKDISNVVIRYQDTSNWLSNTISERIIRNEESNNSCLAKTLIWRMPHHHHLFYVFVKTVGNEDALTLTPSALCASHLSIHRICVTVATCHLSLTKVMLLVVRKKKNCWLIACDQLLLSKLLQENILVTSIFSGLTLSWV